MATAFEAYTREQKAANAKAEKHNRKIRRWTRAATVGAILYTFVSGLIFVLTIRGVHEASRQADISRDNEIVSNRAFIISNSVKLVSYGDPSNKERSWIIAPILENVGNSATKGLHYMTKIDYCLQMTDEGMKQKEKWGIGIDWLNTTNTPWVYNLIGPKSEILGANIPIANVTLNCAIPVSSAGIIKYRDIFGYHHITEFCDYIRLNIYSGIDLHNYPIGQAVRPNGLPCPYHNCTDEECGADWQERAQDLK
jgi:hypothetical protein